MNRVGYFFDNILRKKTYVLYIIAILIIITVSFVFIFKSNGSFSRIKGQVVCDEIPADLAPGGNNEYGFENIAFYNAVVNSISNINSCGEVTPEKLAAIKKVTANNLGIDNVNGIEYLTGLEEIDLSKNNISNINVGSNTALKKLVIWSNNITDINLDSNTDLRELWLTNNKLNTLILTENTKLEIIHLESNNLDELNLDTNTALRYVYISNNNLTNLDLSATNLDTVTANNNKLASVTLGHHNAATQVELNNNNLTNIDVSGVPNLSYLHLNNNKLEEINLTGLRKLLNLYLENNNISNLIVPSYTSDYYVHSFGIVNLNNNKLQSLDLSNIKLGTLYANNNELSSITFANESLKIQTLELMNNKLNNINITNLNKLKVLKLDNNNISNLPLSNKPELTELTVSNNNLSSINVSENLSLQILDIASNNISEIILTNNHALQSLSVSNNNLSSLIIDNNPLLITVDASYNNLSGINVGQNISISKLYLNNNNISSINGLEELSSLTELVLFDNNISELTLSNPSLGLLMLENNPIEKRTYVKKGESKEYEPGLVINNKNVTISTIDENIATYNDVINGVKAGETSVILIANGLYTYDVNSYLTALENGDGTNSLERLNYFYSDYVGVYELRSDLYQIDEVNNIIYIPLSSTFNLEHVSINIDDLSLTLNKGKLSVLAGDDELNSYIIVEKDFSQGTDDKTDVITNDNITGAEITQYIKGIIVKTITNIINEEEEDYNSNSAVLTNGSITSKISGLSNKTKIILLTSLILMIILIILTLRELFLYNEKKKNNS